YDRSGASRRHIFSNSIKYYHRVVDRITNYGQNCCNKYLVDFESRSQGVGYRKGCDNKQGVVGQGDDRRKRELPSTQSKEDVKGDGEQGEHHGLYGRDPNVIRFSSAYLRGPCNRKSSSIYFRGILDVSESGTSSKPVAYSLFHFCIGFITVVINQVRSSYL